MNRATLTGGLALMDLCWAYPWCVLLGVWTDTPRTTGLLSPISVLALVLFGAWSTALLGRVTRLGRRGRYALAMLALVAATISVRFEHFASFGGLDWVGPFVGVLAAAIGQLGAPVLAFACALYLWWRGVRFGMQSPGFVEVDGAFRWGIARIAAIALMMALAVRPSLIPTLEAQTTPYVVGFFFCSLLTLALARLESLRTRTRRPSLNTQWLAVLVVVAAAVVLVALLLGQILSFDVLIVATRPLFDVLGVVLLLLAYAIVIPMAYVIQWIVYLILALLPGNINRQRPEPLQPTDLQTALANLFNYQLTPEMIAALKAAGAALVLAAVVFFVARGLVRWRPTGADADATNEERESVWDARQLWQKLIVWLRRRFRRDGEATSVASPSTADGAPDEALGDVPRVRALYAELLRQGELAGARRPVGSTPREHAPVLVAVFEPEDSVVQLTDAYQRVRYADLDVPNDEAEALNSQLQDLHPKSATD
jgi:hypothetical protein